MVRGRIHIAPSGRLLCAVLLVAGFATAPPVWRSLEISGLISTILVVTSGRSRRALAVVFPVALMTSVAVLPLAVNDGASLAARIAVRAVISSAAAVAVLGGTRLGEFHGALIAMGAPRALAATVESSLRQLSELKEQGRRLVLARRLRGPVHARDGALLLGAWFARTADRAARVELSMALRGYSPERALHASRLGRADVIAAFSCVLAGLAAHAAGHAW